MDIAARLWVPLLSLAVFWVWESRRPFFGQPQRRLVHAARNLSLALLNTVVVSLVFGLLVVRVVEHAAAAGWGVLRQVDLPETAAFLLCLLVLDATMYVWHRANHRVPLLWRFHRVHHSDPHMDVTTATRFHLGEHAGAFLVRLGLVLATGLEVTHLIAYDLSLIVMTQFHHADISLGRLDPLLRWLVVTPDMHKTHHSDRQEETDSNYGVLFSFWDRLGRSHLVSKDPRAIHFGLRAFSSDTWQTLGGMLRTPWTSRSTPEAEKGPGGASGSRT
jgi:sterol desaturase/sphingolipid hydroxylase (fatty acid hydroxylase superfamily)